MRRRAIPKGLSQMQRVTITLDDDLLVYEHEKRDLASRIVSTQHHHHDLSVATLHVHINHDDCLEIAVLKGDMGDVQHFADDVIAQRGVRHGHLQCLPKED